MREYVCHKRVKAAKIMRIRLVLDNGEAVDADHEWMRKHMPMPGGYLVEYEDGYRSFSPAGPFESGYTPSNECAN